MAIVLNEYEWAEMMIRDRNLGPRPTETLSRIARYYYEKGFSKREVRKLLDQFLIQCNPDASLFFWSDTLDKIVKGVGKFPLLQIDGVSITKSELEVIGGLRNTQLKRLAFTLLCVSKYWDLLSSKNNHWVNSTDKDICKMANISATSKQQDIMYGQMLEAGLIRSSKRIDNLNVQVQFQDNDSEIELLIKDFRNLGYQYLKYIGGPYFECEHCGATVKMNDHKQYQSRKKDQYHNGRGRRQRYCTSCALEIKTKQNVNAVMKRRRSAS